MKAIHSMIAALGLALVLPAAADAATTDPEVLIYRFTGVRDNGSNVNMGVATSFHCTNISGVTETIRFVTRGPSGNLLTNVMFDIGHLATLTASTHNTAAYLDDIGSLNTGFVNQGTTAIAATSINIFCTAETIDASTAAPVGVARHGVRFNPMPGTQE
jgi:hypothetical protein